MRRFQSSPFSLLLLLSIAVVPLSAQSPAADWQTIETRHFRVHYPVEFEAWARDAASKLEPVHERLVRDIGYEPGGKTDVLVMDPLGQANGFAWPLLTPPRMVLWTNPPGPESTIGNYGSWIDMLVVHEYAHVVHILRPSRNPGQRLFERVLPVGPIGLDVPRWAIEGYATVIEGDVTGSGRPNSDLRAAILRRWAQLGRLPSYEQMTADSANWLGMSMAYLVGSTYLEWLRDREGEDSLRKLWARMTARTKREFNAAFEGVYGDSPRRLYDRFTAELTHQSLEIEKSRAGSLREGVLWQDLSWSTEPPDVSPDGSQLLTVLRHRDEPSELVIFSTGSPTQEELKRDKRTRDALERDPLDVPAVQRKPVAREPVYSLNARDENDDFETPRWIPGGNAVLFSRYEMDPEGIFHPDLFIWYLRTGRVARVTRFADLRNADPLPDGRSAIAVRNRHGESQLVRVDLTDGSVQELTRASVAEVVEAPRVSPDGKRVAFLRLENGAWKLRIRDLASGVELAPEVPGATLLALPEWSVDGGSIFLAAGQKGFIEIVSVPANGRPPVEITRSQGAALGAAAASDGIYFLALDVDGFDIRYLPFKDTAEQPLPPFELAADYWPLTGRRSGAYKPLSTTAVEDGRPYGSGRREYSILLGGNYSESSDMFELGVRSGDVIGRLEMILAGSFGGGRGPEGFSLGGVWRGWPVELRAHLFTEEERLPEPLFNERTGAELSASWTNRARYRSVGIDGGVLLGESDDESEQIGFARAAWSAEVPRGELSGGASIGLRGYAGRRDDQSWERLHSEVGLSAEVGDTTMAVSYSRGFSNGDHGEPAFVLGGIESTIVPESAWSGRVYEPAVEVGTLSGDDYEAIAGDLEFGWSGFSFFYQRYRFSNDGSLSGEWFDLAGLRLELESEAMPLLQMPPFTLRLGVAWALEEPLEGETSFWIGMAFRP